MFVEANEDDLKMRLSLCVAKGKYDGILDWPFKPQASYQELTVIDFGLLASM